jgi:hypothetical protein
MKNKLPRIIMILMPLFGVLFAWATWEVKITPYVDKVFISKQALIDFHKAIDTKIVTGEITQDEAIYIFKRNALKSNESEVALASSFKAAVVFMLLAISICLFATITRILKLEIRSNWKL